MSVRKGMFKGDDLEEQVGVKQQGTVSFLIRQYHFEVESCTGCIKNEQDRRLRGCTFLVINNL